MRAGFIGGRSIKEQIREISHLYLGLDINIKSMGFLEGYENNLIHEIIQGICFALDKKGI